MNRLLSRSLLVLALLFGLVFAVGIAVLYYLELPLLWALAFTVVVVGLQYLVSPFLIDWIFKIRWVGFEEFDPEFEAFLTNLCRQRGIPVPRLGLIEDGNPNAFTYGHVPGDARLVVTRGLKEMLEEEEFRAVVAHEVGHIAHYDFVVMTVAAVVPMMLYVLYTWTRDRDRNQATVLVALGAFLAYVISQYIVLLLSRIREYYADEHAARSVREANAISTALVKIAYGLARIPQEAEKTKKPAKGEQPAPVSRVAMIGALGICSFKSSSPMAMFASNAAGEFSPELMARAMQWDLWNPWARLFELQSTHPLVARRVLAASEIARRMGQHSPLVVSPRASLNLWPFFWTDLLFLSLPWVGVVAAIIAGGGVAFFGSTPGSFSMLGLIPLLGGIGWLLRLSRSYGGDFRHAAIAQLVGEVEVSHIRGIPVELRGEIIGRGVPGLFWSKDLVMQDDTGFITLIYRQPLGFLETLFGLFRAGALVGKKGVMRGWYRRGPVPYLELASAQFDDGSRLQCHYRNWLYFAASVITIVGAVILALQSLPNLPSML